MTDIVTDLPAGRRGQVLAMAILLALLALVWFGGVVPLLDWYNDRASQIADGSALAARLEQRAAALPRLRALASNLPPQIDPPALPGASDAESAADLQETLQSLASDANLAFGSTEILPAADDGGYRRVEVRVAFNSDYPSLVKFLRGIAASNTPLVVVGLDLDGPPRGAPSADPSIDSVITVAGWRTGAQ
jgi:Tfp pilus assembly protein PilO